MIYDPAYPGSFISFVVIFVTLSKLLLIGVTKVEAPRIGYDYIFKYWICCVWVLNIPIAISYKIGEVLVNIVGNIILKGYKL